jgi:predicted TPR repeat methyltransferase
MSWDSYADDWDKDQGTRAYSQAAFECLTRLCAERSVRLVSSRTCDFGCGTGLLTEKLAPVCAVVVAVDTSERMIDRLRRKVDQLGLANVHTTTEEIERAVRYNTALFGSPFDLVVCSSVCAFLDDYAGTTDILVRLLKPGGLFVQWDWEFDPRAHEPFGLAREQMKETLSASGLEAIQIRTAFKVSIGDKTVRPLLGVGQAPMADRAIAPD